MDRYRVLQPIVMRLHYRRAMVCRLKIWRGRKAMEADHCEAKDGNPDEPGNCSQNAHRG
ncbi:hypothetical protein [Sinorhizobium meliloti]|uniref:hypothetical protein n=1 Tax=Rhizobium meliloti TaxID=382 RepID=UPI00000CB120|nr:hypothetical protein [Sinorhizobium meliloti]MCK3803118.1 hypothetical protein [Sinorhizobium meliloti]MCK3808920.1 hypothetical protein [Sinorhizobium meliloti]MCK3816439.1 hypothetical protein [Sinorhizobium meliloti]MDE3822979.1 hypothetical protein [Sinorhizobium meliloti]QND30387.1 hypothetical protein HB773_30680 [Sinorhizobium meliloti]